MSVNYRKWVPNFVERRRLSFHGILKMEAMFGPAICSPLTRALGVVTKNIIIQFFQCVMESRTPACLITRLHWQVNVLRNHAWKVRRGLRKPCRKSFVRDGESRRNLNLCVCVCVCVFVCVLMLPTRAAGGSTICAAVQHWPQQMHGCNYISGSSYRRQDAAFFVRPRVRDMASASTLRVFMLGTRHAYKGTNISQLAARVFGSLPKNVLYISWYFKEKETCRCCTHRVELSLVAKIVFETCI